MVNLAVGKKFQAFEAVAFNFHLFFLFFNHVNLEMFENTARVSYSFYKSIFYFI